MIGGTEWDALLRAGAAVFTRPSFPLFWTLVSAWVLCPGRRTVTRMIGIADPEGEHAHDAYHRFLRAGAWTMTELWQILVGLLVRRLAPTGGLHMDLDDTLFHRAGRKIEGAGVFRDPDRSTTRKVVYALGLNVVVLTLRLTPPWGGEPLGLPVNLRLYRKGGPSHLELGAAMLRELATWLPHRDFALTCDGAYAALAGMDLPRTHVTSRMRRDAALYLPPPPRKRGQRGRPRKRGRRLPSPEQLARRTTRGWVSTIIDIRGKPIERRLLCRPVLWYHVCPRRQVLLVIVRDPTGTQPDDFFFTTDLSASPAAVASEYAGRWSIEDTFRSVKQALGGEDPQTWKEDGPERAAALSFWIYAAIWLWYLKVYNTNPSWPALPWYPQKCTPSFADALAALRRTLWRERISANSSSERLSPKFRDGLIEILARAA